MLRVRGSDSGRDLEVSVILKRGKCLVKYGKMRGAMEYIYLKLSR